MILQALAEALAALEPSEARHRCVGTRLGFSLEPVGHGIDVDWTEEAWAAATDPPNLTEAVDLAQFSSFQPTDVRAYVYLWLSAEPPNMRAFRMRRWEAWQ